MTEPTDEARSAALAGIERFSRKAEASLARLRDIQAQLDVLVQPPQPTAVHAEMASDGSLTVLTIDRDLPPADLEHEIGLAIADAARRRPPADPAQVQAAYRAAARSGDLDLTRLVEQLLAGTTDDLTVEPAPHWNAGHTVAVTAQAGLVRRVRCEHPWLASTLRDAVAREVLQTVNEAVVGSTVTPGGR